MNIKTNNMTRLNDLQPQTRLDLIEETRLQRGSEWTSLCVEDNYAIAAMCDWSRTRQGHEYWESIDLKRIIS
jgi:hypothetical protein